MYACLNTCNSGVLTIDVVRCVCVFSITAAPDEILNHPPSFSQDVYIDAVDSGIGGSDVLLTTLHCSDEDDPTGDVLTVSIQPGSLPFAVRIVRSNSEAAGYDVITDEVVEFEQYLESGLQFHSACSDGREVDDAFVAIDIIPTSETPPEFSPLTGINIQEGTAMNTDIGTFSAQVGTGCHFKNILCNMCIYVHACLYVSNCWSFPVGMFIL